MEVLPNEMIEHILKDSNLNVIDVVNFSSTCSKFRGIVNNSSTIWKSKYFQCWPKTDVDITSSDWYEEFITRKNFEKKVYEILSTMSSKFYHLHMKNISSAQLDFVIDLINSHRYGYYYLRDCLITINLLPLSQSLTNKYYGSILLKFINKRHYTQVWKDLTELSIQEQTLEKGAIFVSHWCQENERGISKAVTSDLDNTAELAREHLLQAYKDHPLKYVSKKTLLSWRKENLPGNMFEPHHCKSIISSINYILFDHLKYCIAYDANEMDRKKCGIDYAILDRRATPLIFAVIYESVARRLGVRIEILEFLDHCLLKWKEHYNVEDTPNHYISMSSKGMFMKTRSCQSRCTNKPVIAPCTMQQIAQKVAFSVYPRERGENHLSVKDALELVLVIMPFSLEWYQQLCRAYTLHEMDVRELIGKLLNISSQISEVQWCLFQPLLHSLEIYQKTWEHEYSLPANKTRVVQHRTAEVEFAVGMIVRDRRFDTTGVIYGWDRVCRAPQWNEEVAIQPFYKVLLGDGSNQYVPQEYLQILHTPPFISHPFIGRFFEEYCTTHYKPNKELQEEYPDDMEALRRILRKDREA